MIGGWTLSDNAILTYGVRTHLRFRTYYGDTTVGYSPYINTKWLENVGMSMPTTTDEFEAVLKAFKEQDANGSSDASDNPVLYRPEQQTYRAMAGYFGLPMNKLGIAIQNEKVVYGGVSDTYREFLSWFHKLYADGLVDVELYTGQLHMGR